MANNEEKSPLHARKAALRAKLDVIEGQFRQDLQDLRDDLNPVKRVKKAVTNFINPVANSVQATIATKGPVTRRIAAFADTEVGDIAKAGIANMALRSGINVVGRMLLPGWKWKVARMLIPIATRQSATQQLVPAAKRGLISVLEWVEERTSDRHCPVKSQEMPKPLPAETIK